MTVESKKVNDLLEKYGVFIECPFHKVRCVLTGHELKPSLNALEEYIKSPKFQSAYDVHQILMENPNVFEDLNKNLLGCKYTRRVLSRDRQTLLNHLKGKLFLRRKAKADRGELNINAEPETGADEEDEEVGNLDDEVNDPDMEDTVDEEDDEEDDEDEEIIEIDDDDEEEEEDINYDESYPELSKGRKGSEPVAEDSYDFSVMDTDKESGRKRKTPGKGVADKKKKSKK